MPFTIFSHRSSPEAALAFLSENNALIESHGDDWSASFIIAGRLFRRKRTITFNFERDWCSPPNWPQQLLGMSNYLARFDMDADAKRSLLAVIRQLQFNIGVVCEPEIKDGDDVRLEIIHALAHHLNAILFTPTALLDSCFRAIAAADGEADPDASFPTPNPDVPDIISGNDLSPFTSDAGIVDEDADAEDDWNPVPPSKESGGRPRVGIGGRCGSRAARHEYPDG